MFMSGDVDAHVSDAYHLFSQPEQLFSEWIFSLFFNSLGTCLYMVSDMEVSWVVPVIRFQLKETNELEQ